MTFLCGIKVLTYVRPLGGESRSSVTHQFLLIPQKKFHTAMQIGYRRCFANIINELTMLGIKVAHSSTAALVVSSSAAKIYLKINCNMIQE